MAELSVAVVGLGSMGQVHLQCWANLTGVKVAAVVDSDGVLAARTVMQNEGTAAFVTLKESLGMGPFDIVDVCVPVEERYAAAEMALRNGCHVLSERPIAANAAQAYALAQLAEERERLLMPGFVQRFHPPLLFVRELLDNDDLGLPTMFRCRFSGYWAEAEAERESDVLYDTAGSGIDLFRAFCGEVTDITGHLATVAPNLSVPDTAALLLKSERGAIGVVEASWSSPGGRTVVEIYGTAGAAVVDYDLGTLRYQTADHPLWQSREEGGPNRYERAIAHFADAVRGLQTLVVTGADGARAVELCEFVARQNG